MEPTFTDKALPNNPRVKKMAASNPAFVGPIFWANLPIKAAVKPKKQMAKLNPVLVSCASQFNSLDKGSIHLL